VNEGLFSYLEYQILVSDSRQFFISEQICVLTLHDDPRKYLDNI